MIEAVLFDYGMVLSGPPDPVAWAQMLQITGLTEEQFHAAYWTPRHAYDRGTHTGPEYWLTAGRHAGIELDSHQIARLIDADTALWTQVNQPMVDWAARLQSAGTPTGILSNIGDAMNLGIINKIPWLAAFNHRIFSHTLKLAKPEPEIYRHAAEAFGLAPDRILFVDDRADNCEGGRGAGMPVIQYGAHSDFVAEMDRRGWGALWSTGQLS